MIWDLVWIWVALASLLTVISVWRHIKPKGPDAAPAGNTPPVA